MNANKLADEWDAQGFSEYELERECGNQMANMLRQQQAEIKDLKAKLQLHEAMDNQCASLMQQFRKASEK